MGVKWGEMKKGKRPKQKHSTCLHEIVGSKRSVMIVSAQCFTWLPLHMEIGFAWCFHNSSGCAAFEHHLCGFLQLILSLNIAFKHATQSIHLLSKLSPRLTQKIRKTDQYYGVLHVYLSSGVG